MSDTLITNGSINFDRVAQAELKKVQQLHDEHSTDIEHDNKTIAPEDTELNYHKTLLDIDKLLDEQFGDELKKKNDKLARDFNDGKISLNRYQKRKMTMDKWLNHSGKEPKKAFSLGVVYIGDENQTKEKLDKLGFDYTVEQLKGSDGKLHNHFHLTDPKQRQQWKNIWADTFKVYADAVNKKNSGIKIFDMTVHMDEASPHCHFKILNCGHTKTGKASYNLTQALSDFNVACGCKREYNKVTKKSPKKRISGKLTTKTANALFSKTAVAAFNWSLKRNGFKQQFNFERKGNKAKLTNQMSPKEFKEYQANIQEAQVAYTAVTGQKAFHADNTPLSPLEMAKGFSKAMKNSQKKLKHDEQVIKQRSQKLDNREQQLKQLEQRLAIEKQKGTNYLLSIQNEIDNAKDVHDDVKRYQRWRNLLHEHGIVNQEDYLKQQQQIIEDRDNYKQAAQLFSDQASVYKSALSGGKSSIKRSYDTFQGNGLSMLKTAEKALKQAENWFKTKFKKFAFPARTIQDVKIDQKQDRNILARQTKVADIMQQVQQPQKQDNVDNTLINAKVDIQAIINDYNGIKLSNIKPSTKSFKHVNEKQEEDKQVKGLSNKQLERDDGPEL